MSIVRDTVKGYGMIRQGDLVICGVSGGPDSMCLLDSLIRLRQEMGFSLHVGYLHHHMREQADSDVKMVMSFSKERNIPVTVGHAEVLKMAEELGIGSEEAGRIARYRFYFHLLQKLKGQKIALGHNKNDQAETVIMRLARGAGTKGLSGIPPVRGAIIRPILNVSRPLIEKYCEEKNIPTITDSYNLDLRYTRNLVRYEVLPKMVESLNPSLVDTLADTAKMLSFDAEYLEEKARKAFLRHSIKEGAVVCIDDNYLRTAHKAIASRVLEMAWRESTGRTDNLHINNILEALSSSKPITLPGRLQLSKEDGWVRLYPAPKTFVKEIKIPGKTVIEELGITVCASFVDKKVNQNFRQNALPCKLQCKEGRLPSFMVEPTCWVDYNKCAEPLTVRVRKEGDRFRPLGFGGRRQRLKDFFTGKKVPGRFRDFVPLVTSKDKIIWVGGMRLSEEVKVDENTSKVLKMKIEPCLRYRMENDIIP